jgi:hypothetical protein
VGATKSVTARREMEVFGAQQSAQTTENAAGATASHWPEIIVDRDFQ